MWILCLIANLNLKGCTLILSLFCIKPIKGQWLLLLVTLLTIICWSLLMGLQDCIRLLVNRLLWNWNRRLIRRLVVLIDLVLGRLFWRLGWKLGRCFCMTFCSQKLRLWLLWGLKKKGVSALEFNRSLKDLMAVSY